MHHLNVDAKCEMRSCTNRKFEFVLLLFWGLSLFKMYKTQARNGTNLVIQSLKRKKKFPNRAPKRKSCRQFYNKLMKKINATRGAENIVYLSTGKNPKANEISFTTKRILKLLSPPFNKWTSVFNKNMKKLRQIVASLVPAKCWHFQEVPFSKAIAKSSIYRQLQF